MKQKNSKVKTVKRIFNYLKAEQQKGEYKTPSQIMQELGIEYNSVLSVLDFLQELGKIKIISNGNVSIVQVMEGTK